jgi:hypothetical protein
LYQGRATVFNEDAVDLLNDPEFIPRGSVLGGRADEDNGDRGGGECVGDRDGSRGEDESEDAEEPSVMDDHPAIRNAYIRAFVAASFAGSTHKAVQIQLEGASLLLRSAQNVAPDLEFPGLERMARTLPTVEKRLGVSTTGLIIYYFICDVCWRIEHPSKLYKLNVPNCTEEDCTGRMYTTKRLSDGTEKRIPTKILSYVPPKQFIQHQLRRPGKWDQLQHWRGPDDAPGEVPPLTTTSYDAFVDLGKPICDVYDAFSWRAVKAGLQRRRGGRWEVEDITVRELDQRFVSLPCGLLLQMNIDWWVYI